jgi:hypothetical protein
MAKAHTAFGTLVMVNNSNNINKRNNHLLPQIIEHWKDHDIGCWKLRGPTLYLGTGTKCIIQFSVLIIYNLIFQWQIYHNMNPSQVIKKVIECVHRIWIPLFTAEVNRCIVLEWKYRNSTWPSLYGPFSLCPNLKWFVPGELKLSNRNQMQDGHTDVHTDMSNT